MISQNTRNQIRFTARNRIKIDYNESIMIAESQYWENCDEITINQSEFESLNLKYMHIKHPRLNKKNPYQARQIYLFDKKLLSFQQLYTDEIKVKIVAEPEIITEISEAKYYKEHDNNWQHELDYIRNYKRFSLERIHKLEDIVINYEERLDELERRAYLREELFDEMDKFWFENNIKHIKLPSDIYNNIDMVSKKYELSYDEVWYVWTKQEIERIKEIIENLNQQIDEFE